jgi:hypothetical protein
MDDRISDVLSHEQKKYKRITIWLRKRKIEDAMPESIIPMT